MATALAHARAALESSVATHSGGPHALIVLKDGHVGSEWFADLLARQPGTRFIFEAGPCVTRSLATKIAFVVERRGCACTKEDCSDYKKFFADAPCLDEPSARSCRLLGHSHISVTTKGEAAQWEAALRNATPGTVTVLVQTRSNLMKWAWSFYRTGAMARLRREHNGTAPLREINHLRDESNRSHAAPVVVQPAQLLRLAKAKQARSQRLIAAAHGFARVTGRPRARVLLYEAMQADAADELRALYRAMALEFDEAAHLRVEEHALRKHAPEDLSRAIANWDELKAYFAPYPCLLDMLTEASPRVYDGCGARYSEGEVPRPVGGMKGWRCECSWMTPIVPQEPRRGGGGGGGGGGGRGGGGGGSLVGGGGAKQRGAARRRRSWVPARGAWRGARHGGGSVAFVFLAAVGAAALLAGLLLLVGRMEVGGSVAAAFV